MMYATPGPPVRSLLATTSAAPATATSATLRRSSTDGVRGLRSHPGHRLPLDNAVDNRVILSSPSSGVASASRQSTQRPSTTSPIPTLSPSSSPPQNLPSQRRTKHRSHSSLAETSTIQRPFSQVDGSSEATQYSAQIYTSGDSPHASTSLTGASLFNNEPTIPGSMTRHRASTAHGNDFAPFGYMPLHPATSRDATNPVASAESSHATPAHGAAPLSTSAPTTMTPSTHHAKNQLPSIRFVCHQDLRGARPSLAFNTMTRILPNKDATIRVGRYSERDGTPEISTNLPSDAPIGFKSKVVSRRHCVFWSQNDQWFIKDVKSSSGTFLNHIRLSQPGVESRPWPIHNGDIVQLGIDFKGGEEMIFRCVKIRIECNRGWHKAPNSFNKKTHKHIRNLAKKGTPVGIEPIREGDAASVLATDCAICLTSIAPCQSLFVAPCSHTWHYKCIRPVINGPNWPQFQCPNCRAYADLEADVDEPSDMEGWEDDDLEDDPISGLREPGEPGKQRLPDDDPTFVESASRRIAPDRSSDEIIASSTGLLSLRELGSNEITATGISATRQREIEHMDAAGYFAEQSPQTEASDNSAQYFDDAEDLREIHSLAEPARRVRSLAMSPSDEGVGTPRNNAGPFVLDGSHGGGMDSLDRALSA